jgi:hypothetical protein
MAYSYLLGGGVGSVLAEVADPNVRALLGHEFGSGIADASRSSCDDCVLAGEIESLQGNDRAALWLETAWKQPEAAP